MLNQRLSGFNHVVAIGGGHGLGRVLGALSFLGDKLTGIVATTDNGGSTGRIREDQHTIAWGDLRNCLSHLTPRPSLGSVIFDHRFSGQHELAGHNLGNMILYAMDQLSVRPLDAVNLVRNWLQINTQIIPMSESPTHLVAISMSGDKFVGELNVDSMQDIPVALLLEPKVKATQEAYDAILKADLIIISPGSFLTSILPSLLLPELAAAMRESNAPVIFIDNLTQEPSSTHRFTIDEKLAWIAQVVEKKMITDVIQLGQSPVLFKRQVNGIAFHEFPMVSSHHRGLHDKLALGDAICQVSAKKAEFFQIDEIAH